MDKPNVMDEMDLPAPKPSPPALLRPVPQNFNQHLLSALVPFATYARFMEDKDEFRDYAVSLGNGAAKLSYEDFLHAIIAVDRAKHMAIAEPAPAVVGKPTREHLARWFQRRDIRLPYERQEGRIYSENYASAEALLAAPIWPTAELPAIDASELIKRLSEAHKYVLSNCFDRYRYEFPGLANTILDAMLELDKLRQRAGSGVTREEIAQALCRGTEQNGGSPWGGIDKYNRSHFYDQADNVLAGKA